MADISGDTQALINTPMLVRRKLRRASEFVINDQEIMMAIIEGDSEIVNALTPWPYSADQLGPDDPWSSPVLIPLRVEQTGLRDTPQPNQGSGYLRAVDIQSTAITDDYTVVFTSSTAFDVTALFLGGEGSGTVGNNFTATSGNVILPSTYWNSGTKEGDRFFFSTFLYYPALVRLSAEFAAGIMYREIYGSDVPRNPRTGRDLLDDAARKLERYQKPDGKDGLRLPSISPLNTNPIEHGEYAISDYGLDTADYTPFVNIPDGVTVL